MMFFRPNRILLAQFDNQFSQNNGFVVYRRHGKGSAYRLTNEQTEGFRDQYIRAARAAHFRYIGLTIAVLLIFATASVVVNIDPDSPLFYAVVAGLLVALVALYTRSHRRLLTQPERELEREVPVAPELTRDEARKDALEKVSYFELLLAPFGGLILLTLAADYIDVRQGWGRLAWILPLGFTLLALLQGVRKFRFSRSR